MNGEEKAMKKSETAQVAPPPFRQSEQHEEPQEAPRQEPSASPTLVERIVALELDEEATHLLIGMTSSLDSESVPPEMLDTLARGVTHAVDVQNADAAGYLRGRNEKIEAVLQPEPEEEEPMATPVFPRYCRRSIWDR